MTRPFMPIIAVAAVMASQPGSTAPQATLAEEPRRPSVVLLEGLDRERGPTGCGCGTVITIDGRECVVTARHVVAGATDVWVNAGPGGHSNVTAVIIDRPDLDLIVLGTDKQLGAPALTLSVRPRLRQRESCSFTAMDEDGRSRSASGELTYESDVDTRHLRTFSFAATPGSSGAPVIDDKGLLVGVIIGGSSNDGDALAAPEILQAIEDTPKPRGQPFQEWAAQPGVRPSVEFCRRLQAAKAHEVEGRTAEALSLGQAALELDPANIDAVDLVIRSLHRLNRDAESLAVLRAAVAAQPKSAAAQFRLGRELIERQLYREARNCFDLADSIEQRPVTAYWRAWARYVVRERADAEPILEEATRAYPRHAGLWEFLAACAGAIGDEQTAREAMRTLVDLCPGDSAPLANLAIFESRSGSAAGFDDAIKRLDPLDPYAAVRMRREAELMGHRRAFGCKGSK